MGTKDKEQKKSDLTRREFTKGMVTASIGLFTIGTPIIRPLTAKAATPKKGGLARIAFESSNPTDTLDPIRVTSNIDATRCSTLYNNLLRMGADLQPQAQLAESWEPNSNATEWVFKLRKGVEFHNGKTLTSADVVYTVSRHLGEKSESNIRAFMAQIAEVKADGKHTVRFKIKKPNAEFPILFSSCRAGMIPEGHTDFENPIGTGPFKVKEWKPGIHSLFVRNKNYFKGGLPYLDAVKNFGIPDVVSRVSALLSSEIELAFMLDAKSVPIIKMAKNAELEHSRSGQLVYQVLMRDRPPTNNKDFRLAMMYLQDRERVVKTVYKGYAQIGNDHPIAPTDPMYCKDIPIRPYDPDKAKFHLKKAGMEKATIDIYNSTTAGAGNVEQTLLFQQTAAKAGLTVHVKQTPPEGYWSHTAMKYPIYGSNWNTRPTAGLMFGAMLMSDAPWNETKHFDENIDKLVGEARGELDLARKKQIWCELQRIVHEDGGCMVSCFVDYLDARSSKVQGFKAHPMGGLSDYLNGEKIWLET